MVLILKNSSNQISVSVPARNCPGTAHPYYSHTNNFVAFNIKILPTRLLFELKVITLTISSWIILEYTTK